MDEGLHTTLQLPCDVMPRNLITQSEENLLSYNVFWDWDVNTDRDVNMEAGLPSLNARCLDFTSLAP